VPGRPLQNRVVAALTERAVKTLGDDATPLAYAADYVAGGRTIADLAVDLAADLGEPVSRQLVSQTIHALEPNAKERIEAARKESALALAEETKDIADNAEPTAGGAAKARLRIGSRQWMAERFAPEQFGTRPSINLNIGALMLDALRQPIESLAPARIVAPLEAIVTPLLEDGSTTIETEQ